MTTSIIYIVFSYFFIGSLYSKNKVGGWDVIISPLSFPLILAAIFLHLWRTVNQIKANQTQFKEYVKYKADKDNKILQDLNLSSLLGDINDFLEIRDTYPDQAVTISVKTIEELLSKYTILKK
ncbi:hypothetical protein [Flavobacterium phage FPSV-S1]|nr:hypothetical protein [Flavobacterium phage FPSV-S1]QCW20512.1 hypothetical protein [Flavobacterium phage FPSV-S8]